MTTQITPATTAELALSTKPSKIVNELTLIFGGIYVALGIITSSSILTELPDWVGLTATLASIFVGAVQAGLKNYAQSKVIAASEAAEVRVGDALVAGPANDLVPTGAEVRSLDTATL